MIILIDSDVLIEVLGGGDAGILEKWAGLANSSDALLCSPVSVAEIWHGTRPREHTAIAKLLGALSCVPIDVQTGERAGVYLRGYHKSHGIELGDALIAAAAAQHHAAPRTRNRKHYPKAAWRPAPGRHNIWELTLHAASWKYVVRRRITGEKRGSFVLEGSNFFARPIEQTEGAWKTRHRDAGCRAPSSAA